MIELGSITKQRSHSVRCSLQLALGRCGLPWIVPWFNWLIPATAGAWRKILWLEGGDAGAQGGGGLAGALLLYRSLVRLTGEMRTAPFGPHTRNVSSLVEVILLKYQQSGHTTAF